MKHGVSLPDLSRGLAIPRLCAWIIPAVPGVDYYGDVRTCREAALPSSDQTSNCSHLVGGRECVTPRITWQQNHELRPEDRCGVARPAPAGKHPNDDVLRLVWTDD